MGGRVSPRFVFFNLPEPSHNHLILAAGTEKLIDHTFKKGGIIVNLAHKYLLRSKSYPLF